MRMNLLALLALALPVAGAAKMFETSYLQIGIPDSWSCERIETAWACKPTDNRTIHTASLVFTAKGAAPEDSLTAIESHLKSTRTITGANGRSTVTSQLRWARKITLNGYEWVEALHSNREVEGFHSYYLSTVTPQLTILIHFLFQQSLSAIHEPVLQELRRSVGLKSEALMAPAEAVNPQPLAPVAPDAPEVVGSNRDAEKPANSPQLLWIIGVVSLSLIAFYAMRRKSR